MAETPLNPIFDELPPPPARRTLTQEERYRKNRRFAVVLNWFVLGYSALHKLILPLFVFEFSYSSAVRAAAQVDWWWTYHVVLAALLLRKNWDDAYLCFAKAVGFGGVLAQIVACFVEYNWHIVSLWVTSAATLGLLVFLRSITRFRRVKYGRDFLYGIGIPIGFGIQFAFFGLHF